MEGIIINPNSAINVPRQPGQCYCDYMRNNSSNNLLVDGSSTAKTFAFNAITDQDLLLMDLIYTLVGSNLKFGVENFGNKSALTNGIKLGITDYNGAHDLFAAKINEEMLLMGSWFFQILDKDILQIHYHINGAWRLRKNTSDKITLTIQDDLDNNCLSYFTCFVKAVKEYL